jgi:DnaK suppressor protein
MNVQDYKRRLLDLETQLSKRVDRHHAGAREQAAESVRDSGDSSVADADASQAFTEAELDATVLQQVRDALERIDKGTFGRCVVDGGPIEPKRLEALPWTPYCAKHQRLLEAASRPRTPSL